MTHPQNASLDLKGTDLLLHGIDEVIGFDACLAKIKEGKSLRVKLGIDPTAPDLHLGHSVVMNKLKHFQEQNHTIVLIIGDFTSSIGDPTGRNILRPTLSMDEIQKNATTYQAQAFKILGKQNVEIYHNSEWFNCMNLDKFFSLAFHVTVQRTLERDDFSLRLKQNKPISIAEMLYPLLQGYDSIQVKSDIELGGRDQKFNLLMARHMQKNFNQSSQAILTVPLLVGRDGVKKMSKSYQNTIELNTSQEDMFGKLMSIPDHLMSQYYALLTDVSWDVVSKQYPHFKQLKMNLASIITERFYGIEGATVARARFEEVFSQNKIPTEIEEYHCNIDPIQISHLLFISQLALAKKEAKRMITQNAVKIDGNKVTEDITIHGKKPIILSVGKRKFKKIIF